MAKGALGGAVRTGGDRHVVAGEIRTLMLITIPNHVEAATLRSQNISRRQGLP
jgi:hypothetical protein